MTNLLNVLLMAQGGKGGDPSFIIMLLLLVVVFYFFMMRPQMKKAKEQKKFRENLKKGDKVITIGGIYGKIVDIFEKAIVIEVESGAKLRISKEAVSADNSLLVAENK